jgi:hypothetical protein|tara:strand:+ start:146 stop:562 length:417 start_codon:yes stop_codon:yes gene_type:complete
MFTFRITSHLRATTTTRHLRHFSSRKRRKLPDPVILSNESIDFFTALQKQRPLTGGFRLSLVQAENNMQMQFSFDFLTLEQAKESKDERAMYDAEENKALHVDESCLMKVLGSTIHYDSDDGNLKVIDKQGFELSPET